MLQKTIRNAETAFPYTTAPIGYPLRPLGSFRLGVGSVQESLLHSLRLIDVSHIDH